MLSQCVIGLKKKKTQPHDIHYYTSVSKDTIPLIHLSNTPAFTEISANEVSQIFPF